jgi:flavin-dependent dehydrogenase
MADHVAEIALMRADDAAGVRWDAIVVGAGPAGSLTACLLARERLKVLLVERQRLPRPKVCGGCLNARALAALDHAGLATRVRALGAREVHSLSLHLRGRTASVELPSGLAVSRRALDAELASAAVEAGAALFTSTMATVVPDNDGSERNGWRDVTLRRRDGPGATVSARVVVSADGLAHTSLRECAAMESLVFRASRVGIGGEAGPGAVEVKPGAITMAVGRHGYVGAVEVEGGRVNIAAAVDPAYLKSEPSAAHAIHTVLLEAGVGTGPALGTVNWTGTIALTRRLLRPAARRIFVLGDAAGYVEPFTGEGMAWALAGAESVVPFVKRAVDSYGSGLEDEWVQEYRRNIGRDQRWCRFLARLLRAPVIVAPLVALLGRRPGLARPVMAHFAPRSTSADGRMN